MLRKLLNGLEKDPNKSATQEMPERQPLGPARDVYRVLKLHGSLPLSVLITMAGNEPRAFVERIELLQRGGWARLNNKDALPELRALARAAEESENDPDPSTVIYAFTRRVQENELTSECRLELTE